MGMDKWLRNYNRGEYIALQGEKAHTFGVLHKGYVGIYRDDQRIATIQQAGDFVGEMAWLLNEPRTASIRAETNGVTIYLIPTAGFAQVAKANPTLLLRLSQNLARRLQRVTRELSQERVAVPGEARLVGSEPATARLINLIRAACMVRPDDDLLSVLLMHILRMTGPANPNVEPPHDGVKDLADIAYAGKKAVDVKALIERIKNEVFTPQTNPKAAENLQASIAPGTIQRQMSPDTTPAPDPPPADSTSGPMAVPDPDSIKPASDS